MAGATNYECELCLSKFTDSPNGVEIMRDVFGGLRCCKCVEITRGEDKLLKANPGERDYIVGWVISSGTFDNNGVFMVIDKDKFTFKDHIKRIDDHAKVRVIENRVIVGLYSPSIIKFITTEFGIGENSRLITKCPYDYPRDHAFFRALFEAKFDPKNPGIGLTIHPLLMTVMRIGEVPYDICQQKNMLANFYDSILSQKLLHDYLKERGASEENKEDMERLTQMAKTAGWHTPIINVYLQSPQMSFPMGVQYVQFIKADPEAKIPKKVNACASGYDLVMIKKVWEKPEDNQAMYDSGIIAVFHPMLCSEIRARSSIFKLKCRLANGVGTIDADYRGTLKIVLERQNERVPFPDTPLICVQLVPTWNTHCIAFESSTVPGTSRGSGGFGSTGSAGAHS